ncbi:hypothetical protein [Streptomyces silvisoli]|uniref:Uncharacterized protein n=1 Tax=Streptomyces silvisoli TaxID=3034235 RepID=A0ABT5ZQL2_9ACTN|nr:hypothetical protein [Streptomyces silvisoli]MDF3291849.1 hypothetical protein [Streptomyces silvisoli]
MTADQLTVLCQRLADDTDAVRSSPEVRALAESIVGRVRDGVPLDELAGDFDELEEQLLRAGHVAGLSPTRSYERLLGTRDGHRVLEVLVCPRGTCTRVEAPGAEPVPCLVYRRPMAVRRLRS